MVMETIKLTRQQLFDLVWTKPMYELCQQFGLSSNGLRKNCKKLNIPIPYIGYWSKLKYGKNPEKTPLPKTLDSSNAVVELKKLNEEELARHKFKLEEDKPNRTPYDVVKEEIDQMNPKLFVVPERLYAKDPLIFDTKEKYRDKHNGYWERSPYTSKAEQALNVQVSKGQLERALKIFSTIIKVLRKRGHDVIVKERETFALIHGERVLLRLQEKKKRIENPNEKQTYYKYLFVDSGHLRFEMGIDDFSSWHRPLKVEDNEKRKLEDCIKTIVTKIEYQYIHILERRAEEERRRREWEEKERIRKEKERQEQLKKERHDIEVSRLKRVFVDAERYNKANILRIYIKEIEAHNSEGQHNENIEWIKQKIEWLDPFINKEDHILNESDYEYFI